MLYVFVEDQALITQAWKYWNVCFSDLGSNYLETLQDLLGISTGGNWWQVKWLKLPCFFGISMKLLFPKKKAVSPFFFFSEAISNTQELLICAHLLSFFSFYISALWLMSIFSIRPWQFSTSFWVSLFKCRFCLCSWDQVKGIFEEMLIRVLW